MQGEGVKVRAEGTRNVGWTDNETGTKYMRLVVGSGSSAGGRQEGHSQEAFEHEESMGSESRAGHEDQRGHRDSREESSCASPAVRKSCLRPRVPCRPGLLRRGGAKSLPCDYVGAKSPGESFKVALGGGGAAGCSIRPGRSRPRGAFGAAEDLPKELQIHTGFIDKAFACVI